MTQLPSRERLEEVAELARKATYKPCALHMSNLIASCDSEMVEAMARALLAAHEQEPSEYLTHVIDDGYGEFSDKMSFSLPVGTKLYTHPAPVPAVPDVAEAVREDLDRISCPDAYMRVTVEACRAAMLNGGKS